MNDTELIEKILYEIAQFGNGKLEFETPEIERILQIGTAASKKFEYIRCYNPFFVGL